jgi:phosphoglycerate dehydrogenase-like enzyme
MRQCTIWVLARANDPGLASLRDLPEGVTCIVGDSPDAFAGRPPADAILVCSLPRALRGTLERAPGVRWVHSRSAGVETLVYPELEEAGIVLTNSRGVYSASLAEFVMAAVFHFAKDLRRLIRNQAARRWEQYVPAMVKGQAMGIVGYGDVGRAVAGKARAMGMRIAALRRNAAAAPDPVLDATFPAPRLLDLMAWSDVVVVATPLTPETRGLIGVEEIRAMQPSGILINVGRGPVVQEQALVEALLAGAIGGAALDVFETEPLPADSPLWSLENVLLSPHCADQVQGWLEPAMECFRANLERFVAGKPLQNVVDPRRGY